MNDQLTEVDADEIANIIDYLMSIDYQHSRINWRFVRQWTWFWVTTILAIIGIIMATNWLRSIGG